MKPKPVIEVGRLSGGRFENMGVLKESYLDDGISLRKQFTPDDLIDNVKEFRAINKAYHGEVQMDSSTFNNLKADFQMFKTGNIPKMEGAFTFKFPNGTEGSFYIPKSQGNFFGSIQITKPSGINFKIRPHVWFP